MDTRVLCCTNCQKVWLLSETGYGTVCIWIWLLTHNLRLPSRKRKCCFKSEIPIWELGMVSSFPSSASDIKSTCKNTHLSYIYTIYIRLMITIPDQTNQAPIHFFQTLTFEIPKAQYRVPVSWTFLFFLSPWVKQWIRLWKVFLKRDRQSPSECLTSALDDLTGEFSGSDVPTDACKQWRWCWGNFWEGFV